MYDSPNWAMKLVPILFISCFIVFAHFAHFIEKPTQKAIQYTWNLLRISFVLKCPDALL
jgi:hypothetical protein